jgi:cystathionine gamma-synthase
MCCSHSNQFPTVDFLEQHGHTITYASGLAAAFSVSLMSDTFVHLAHADLKALAHFKPKRIAISGGYMGCHGAIDVYLKGRFEKTPIVELEDDYQEGDLCWLETPVNPTGESR